MTINLKKLSDFISIKSIDGENKSNLDAISFIRKLLEPAGFTCKIVGTELTDQPALVANYSGNKSRKKIVIYGHYDVAPVKTKNKWMTSDPFKLESIDNRLYGRGIADNKGPLYTRIEAIIELISNQKEIPEILWLIQGEEEVATRERVATNIFNDELKKFNCNLFIEETGFNDIDSDEPIAFVWSPNQYHESLNKFKGLIQDSLGIYNIENRHLNKFNGFSKCPLLNNLDQNSIYIGFGPNDKLHNIHRDNESLSFDLLATHKTHFSNFITHYAKS